MPVVALYPAPVLGAGPFIVTVPFLWSPPAVKIYVYVPPSDAGFWAVKPPIVPSSSTPWQ